MRNGSRTAAAWLIICLGLAAGGCGRKSPPPVSSPDAPAPAERAAPSPETGPLPVGALAPDWVLNDIHGQPLRLADFRGRKGVLLVFWNTTCASCVAEIPDLIAFHTRFRDRAVEVVALAVEQPDRVAKRFAEEKQIPYRVAADPDAKVFESYRASGYPMLFGVDKAGVIRFVHHELPKDQEALVKQLEPAG